MTGAFRTALLIVSMVVCPAIGRAQEAPAEQPEEERPTGLPSPITWTFNFDAGWGSFGFANSLFDNPKEPGVEENLSDQWFEWRSRPTPTSIGR